MSGVLNFPSRPASKARRSHRGESCLVVQLPRRGAIAYAERLLFEGRKRKQWACVTVEADGEAEAHPFKTEHDALWLVGLMLEKFAHDRATDRGPLKLWLDQAFTLPKEFRHAIGRQLLADVKE
jgi:hypothetical protein